MNGSISRTSTSRSCDSCNGTQRSEFEYGSQASQASSGHREIVCEARRVFHARLEQGDLAAGRKALEEGLNVLSSQEPEEECAEWLSSKIEILGDLGRYEEGQHVLKRWLRTTRSVKPDVPTTVIEDTDADAEFERDKRELLQYTVHLRQWNDAVEAGARLGLDSRTALTVSSLEEGIDKCKDLFDFGLAQENLAREEAGPSERIEMLKRALLTYDEGCQLIAQCHLKFDHPKDPITGFDHRTCANLFTSAARICLTFSEVGVAFAPADVGCFPALRERDWRHQALEFVERGRSRALLNLILENKKLVPQEPGGLIDEVLQAFQAALRRRRSSSSSSDKTKILDPRNLVQMFRPASSALSHSPNRGLTPDWHSTNSEEPVTPPAGAAIAPGRLSPRAQGNWQKAINSVLDSFRPKLKDYPVIDSALADESGSFAEMRASIPADTVLVEFAQASKPPKGIMVLILTDQDVKAASWRGCDVNEVNALIHDAGKSMHQEEDCHGDDHGSGDNRETPVSRQAGLNALQALSKLLIEPFVGYFAGKQRIVFITSGNLAHIPFAMLPLSDPLVLSHAVTVAPSFSIWTRLQRRHGDLAPSSPASPPGGHPNVTVVSNSPLLPSGALRDDRIPYSRVEALHLARLHGGWPVLADRERRESFQRLGEESHIFHLSAHGTFERDQPWLSRVHVLEGSLRVIDLAGFNLQALLVVFSSCLSGLSRGSDSGSAFGFAHTLLGSGAQAFVGTLWPVDDAATLLVMMLFYQRIRAGASPAESLRDAQREMRGLTKRRFEALVGDLDGLLTLSKAERDKYVYNLRYRLTEHLPRRSVEAFRQPRSWAGFILTGYGDQPICPRKRRIEAIQVFGRRESSRKRRAGSSDT